MATVIQLHVHETGRPGEVFVDVVTPGAMDVSFLYTPDVFGAPEIGEWQLLTTVQAPVSLHLTLPDDSWSLLQAVGVYAGQLELSPVQRVRPWSNDVFYRIDVAREAIGQYVVGRTTAYRLRMQAVNAQNLSDKVFLYQKVPADALSRELKDHFVAVCKPGDLETFPADSPDPAQVYPFYRLSAVDLVEENIFKLEETADAIVNDVRELLLALEANRRLKLDNIYRLYAGTDMPSSSSSSSA